MLTMTVPMRHKYENAAINFMNLWNTFTKDMGYMVEFVDEPIISTTNFSPMEVENIFHDFTKWVRFFVGPTAPAIPHVADYLEETRERVNNFAQLFPSIKGLLLSTDLFDESNISWNEAAAIERNLNSSVVALGSFLPTIVQLMDYADKEVTNHLALIKPVPVDKWYLAAESMLSNFFPNELNALLYYSSHAEYAINDHTRGISWVELNIKFQRFLDWLAEAPFADDHFDTESLADYLMSSYQDIADFLPVMESVSRIGLSGDFVKRNLHDIPLLRSLEEDALATFDVVIMGLKDVVKIVRG